MTAREKMIDYRNEHYVTLSKMARRLRISEKLLDIIERGGVTHPNIVQRIKEEYGFTETEANELLPPVRRPGHPDYDPERYVVAADPNKFGLMPKQDEIERYVTENNYRQSKKGRV